MPNFADDGEKFNKLLKKKPTREKMMFSKPEMPKSASRNSEKKTGYTVYLMMNYELDN